MRRFVFTLTRRMFFYPSTTSRCSLKVGGREDAERECLIVALVRASGRSGTCHPVVRDHRPMRFAASYLCASHLTLDTTGSPRFFRARYICISEGDFDHRCLGDVLITILGRSTKRSELLQRERFTVCSLLVVEEMQQHPS